MNIDLLRKLADREEIDYTFLLSALRDYSQPRDKISEWLRSGDLIRIKKGLYVFGKNAAQYPYSKEILANLIYGPSTVSLHYALSFYGLIPERVVELTNVTNKRNKKFLTPIGTFSYYYLNPKKYPVGVELKSVSHHGQFLIASPEKALCDVLYLSDKDLVFNNTSEIESYLFRDLRLDEDAMQTLKIKKIEEISISYQHKKVTMLYEYIKYRGRKRA